MLKKLIPSLILITLATPLFARNLSDIYSTTPFTAPETTPFLNSGWYSGDKQYAQTRKRMLRFHQFSGLTTWMLWLATNLEGEEALKELKPKTQLPALFLYSQNPQANLPLYLAMVEDNPAFLFLSGDSNYVTQNYPLYMLVRQNSEWSAGADGDSHKQLAHATAGFYFLTASLALLSPSKSADAKKRGFDSIFFHKGLALLHFAAMASLPALGEDIEHKGKAGAGSMQSAGWAGFTALTMAMFVVYF